MPLDTWKNFGSQTLAEKAVEKAQRLLKEHTSKPLGDGVRETIDIIRNKAVADFENIIFES